MDAYTEDTFEFEKQTIESRLQVLGIPLHKRLVVGTKTFPNADTPMTQGDIMDSDTEMEDVQKAFAKMQVGKRSRGSSVAGGGQSEASVFGLIKDFYYRPESSDATDSDDKIQRDKTIQVCFVANTMKHLMKTLKIHKDGDASKLATRLLHLTVKMRNMRMYGRAKDIIQHVTAFYVNLMPLKNEGVDADSAMQYIDKVGSYWLTYKLLDFNLLDKTEPNKLRATEHNLEFRLVPYSKRLLAFLSNVRLCVAGCTFLVLHDDTVDMVVTNLRKTWQALLAAPNTNEDAGLGIEGVLPYDLPTDLKTANDVLGSLLINTEAERDTKRRKTCDRESDAPQVNMCRTLAEMVESAKVAGGGAGTKLGSVVLLAFLSVLSALTS